MQTAPVQNVAPSAPLHRSLYFQVLIAIAIGVLLGYFAPHLGEQMKPLGDGFIKLIKMMIAPIIFCTVVTGIAGMESMKDWHDIFEGPSLSLSATNHHASSRSFLSVVKSKRWTPVVDEPLSF